MDIATKVKLALDDLGSTPYQAANTLAYAQIKGYRMGISRCPIAIYLQEITGEQMRVGRDICFDKDSYDLQVELPIPVQRFIQMFDHGCKFRAVRMFEWAYH